MLGHLFELLLALETPSSKKKMTLEHQLEWIDSVNKDRKDLFTKKTFWIALMHVYFIAFASWKSSGFERFMKEIAEYPYTSCFDDAASLLRYLWNLNHHFRDVKTCSSPIVDEVDHAI
ncbi:hypothetical protein GBA52_020400 [Prunus armeniaca]|nr:hypothetical protein GBA52_020400 [Prunus armeniaca]